MKVWFTASFREGHQVEAATTLTQGYRSHVWKQQLQRLADKLGLAIHVSHFPPGTSNYPTGKKVSARELRELTIERDEIHGDWNYVIRPRKQMS